MSALPYGWVADRYGYQVTRGFRLGSVRGVEVIADTSLLVIASLLTWSLYSDITRAFPLSSSNVVLVSAIAGGVLFFASVFLHELSHSLMALRRGLAVTRIRLFIFGGVSEIEEEAASPSDELAVTVAGPAASLALGALFVGFGWPLYSAVPIPARVSVILGVANLSIGVFNLLPGLPLDGGRMLRALLWRRSGDRTRATQLAVRTGRGLGALMMAGGVALVAVTTDIAALWFVAVGWFLYEAASTSAVQEQFASRIAGLTVGDVMRRTDLAVDGASTVADALALHGWGEKLRAMPVAVEGRVTGVFGTREVSEIEPEDRAAILVAEAMTVIGPGDVVSRKTGLRKALIPEPGAAGAIVVVDQGEVVGLLTAEELSTIFADLRGQRDR